MKSAPKVLFVADAGASVGGGHVMRCLTLAAALERAGAHCAFAATPEAAAILDSYAGPDVVRLPAPGGDPAALCAAAAQAGRAWGARVAVLDHYGAGPAEDAVLRAAAGRLLAIEDLRRQRECDLLLDASLGRLESDYPGVQALVGPDFALVRLEFAARRKSALTRRLKAGPAHKVLVSLGLTDVGAITGRVVNALLPALGQQQIEVVLGAGAPSLSAIKALATQDPRIGLHVGSKDMAHLVAAADIAIGAGGSSAWERCVLGLPTVTLILADNQRANTTALASAGASLMVEVNGHLPARLKEAFVALASAPAVRARMSQAAADLCDGLGAERVAARILALQ
jgi:UDP-2,4-diacetamido-2,4,6-trideoxy-beta-L-altropyranose hydrolase